MQALIGDGIIDMVESHFLFNRTMEVAVSNPELAEGELFWDNLKKNYASSTVLGVTRQTDDKKEVDSVVRFLMDLKRHHLKVTKEWYMSEYEKLPVLGREHGKSEFEQNFGVSNHLDANIVQADIDSLRQTTAKIENFRNKRVAHKNKDRTLVFDVSFDDLSAALKELERIIKKYQILINQSGMELMPVILYDWERIYRIPWLK